MQNASCSAAASLRYRLRSCTGLLSRKPWVYPVVTTPSPNTITNTHNRSGLRRTAHLLIDVVLIIQDVCFQLEVHFVPTRSPLMPDSETKDRRESAFVFSPPPSRCQMTPPPACCGRLRPDTDDRPDYPSHPNTCNRYCPGSQAPCGGLPRQPAARRRPGHRPRHDCGSGTSRYSNARPAC